MVFFSVLCLNYSLHVKTDCASSSSSPKGRAPSASLLSTACSLCVLWRTLFFFSSLSLLAKCPLGPYLVIRSVERFTEWNKSTDGVANAENLWGLKLDTQVSSSEWQLWHHTSTGLYLQALVSGFSETLPLNSALGMLIVSLSLKFVKSVSWPYLFTHILLYLSLIHAAMYSCLLVALKLFFVS